MFVHITKYLSVSKGHPEPNKSPHQVCKEAFPAKAIKANQSEEIADAMNLKSSGKNKLTS